VMEFKIRFLRFNSGSIATIGITKEAMKIVIKNKTRVTSFATGNTSLITVSLQFMQPKN
jgi:hypothetical protein